MSSEKSKEKIPTIGELRAEHNSRFKDRKLLIRTGFQLQFPLVYTKDSGKEFGTAVSQRDMLLLMGDISSNSRNWKRNQMSITKQLNGGNGIIRLGVDLGQGTLELTFPPTNDLENSKKILSAILGTIKIMAPERGISLLGYGVQPITSGSRALMVENPVHYALANYFNERLFLHTTSATTQVHVDVSSSDYVAILNTLNACAPAIIAITGNSRIYNGKDSGISDIQNTFWHKIVEGREEDKKRVGIAPIFKDNEEYWNTLLGFNMLFTERDQKHLLLEEKETLGTYLRRAHAKAYTIEPQRSSLEITPSKLDITSQESTIFWDARLNSKISTVEFSSCSMQPGTDRTIAVTAFILGLTSNHIKVKSRMEIYTSESIIKAREDSIKYGLKAKIGKEPITDLLKDLLEISKEGLRSSAENPSLIDPLYKSVSSGENPSDKSLKKYQENGMHKFIDYITLRY